MKRALVMLAIMMGWAGSAARAAPHAAEPSPLLTPPGWQVSQGEHWQRARAQDGSASLYGARLGGCVGPVSDHDVKLVLVQQARARILSELAGAKVQFTDNFVKNYGSAPTFRTMATLTLGDARYTQVNYALEGEKHCLYAFYRSREGDLTRHLSAVEDTVQAMALRIAPAPQSRDDIERTMTRLFWPFLGVLALLSLLRRRARRA